MPLHITDWIIFCVLLTRPINNCALLNVWCISFCSEGGEGGGDTSIVRQEEIDRISRKLATLEMKVNPKRTDY